jgi:hypothetical protein
MEGIVVSFEVYPALKGRTFAPGHATLKEIASGGVCAVCRHNDVGGERSAIAEGR